MNSHKDNKQILSHLKPLVDNLKLWNSFNDYIDHLVEQDHKKLEQAENTQDMYRAQGSIAMLKRLKYLRDEVKHNGK